MRKSIYGLLLLCLSYSAHGAVQCIKPEQLIRTSVSISQDVMVDVGGKMVPGTAQGTAWFLGLYHMVTVMHVGKVMANSQEWSTVELAQQIPWKGEQEHREQIPVRVVGIHNTDSLEPLVVLELQRFFPGTQIANIRETSLVPGEYLSGVAYPGGLLTLIEGKYIGEEVLEVTEEHEIRGHTVEVLDEAKKASFVQGASGGALFDCDGRVVLSTSFALTRTVLRVCGPSKEHCELGGYDVPIDTPSNTPTILAVSVSGLSRFFQKNMDKRHAP